MAPSSSLVAFGLLAAAQSASPGPWLAPSWSAHAVQEYGASSIPAQVGTFWRDRPRERWRFQSCNRDGFCTDELRMHVGGPTAYNFNITIGFGSDSVCQPFTSPYTDLFDGMHEAVRNGTSEVAGEQCTIWTASVQSETSTRSLSACIASDGVPRQFNLSNGLAFKAASVQHWTFSNITVGQVAHKALTSSDACTNRYPMPPCPNDGALESLELYRVRGSEEPNLLGNRNLADALGEMAYFCSGAADATKLVTLWSLQANSSWGQYGNCLYKGGKNKCYGNTGRCVGRQSPPGLGKGPLQGQCSLNYEVGNWYSIPVDGECPKGSAIGTAGCTWSGRALRSVEAGCILEERGLKESCAAEQGLPGMPKSVAILKAALATSDPAQGGCPDVPEFLV